MSYRQSSYEHENPFKTLYKMIEWFLHAEFMTVRS